MVSKETTTAIEAYRLAHEYRDYILEKWRPRQAELRELDEFHRTHVAWENDCYRFETLIDETGRALLSTINGSEQWVHPFHLKHFKTCRNRKFLKVFKLLEGLTE